jgi:DNA-binding NarL/FixJ family response regulator
MSCAVPHRTKSQTVRILLADDHALVRDSLKALLEGAGFDVVAEASDGAEAVRLAFQFRPDIALLDLSMPVLNGIDAAKQIAEASPSTRTILLTMHNEDRYVLEGLRAGAAGYVLKTRAATALVEAIQNVQNGDVHLSTGTSRSALGRLLASAEPAADVLSARERQALQLIAEGKNTKEIAGMLGLSVKTVESHRARIAQKLNLHTTAELVRYAIRRGLVQA